MPIFETTDALAHYIKFTTIDDIQHMIARYSNQALYEKIKSTVYKTPEGIYQRTEAMLDSIDSNEDELKLSKYTSYVDTAPNPKEMDYTYPSVNSFDSQDNRNKIVKWLNDGHKGIWRYKPQKFIEKAQSKVKKGLLAYIRLQLKGSGYIVK